MNKPRLTYANGLWSCTDEEYLIYGFGVTPQIAYLDYIHWKNYKFY